MTAQAALFDLFALPLFAATPRSDASAAAPPPVSPPPAAAPSPFHWTDTEVEQALERGAIVDIGQLSPRSRRRLDRRARKGQLVRWRGHWTTLSPDYGFGPLKMIFARPGLFLQKRCLTRFSLCCSNNSIRERLAPKTRRKQMLKIFLSGQMTQVLKRETSAKSETLALIINTPPKGWIAYRAARTDRVSSMGPVFEPTGEGINVSRLVNQHDGAQQIAEALGL